MKMATVTEVIWQNVKNVGRITFFLLIFLTNIFGIFIVHMIVSISLRCVNRRLFRQVQRLFETIFVRMTVCLVQIIAGGEFLLSLPVDSPQLTEYKFKQIFSDNTSIMTEGCCSLSKDKDYRHDLSSDVETSKNLMVSRDLLICNHQIYSDWIFLWALMDRIDRAGELKIIMKRSLRNVPIFGWSMRYFDFVFLNRKWEQDQVHFNKKLSGFLDSDSPFCLLIFPEGTTFNHKALLKSESFSTKLGVKPTSRVLLPRVLGMWEAVKALDSNLSGVYDLTVGYSGLTEMDEPEKVYTLGKLFYAGIVPPQIHYHLKYIPLKEIPRQSADEFGEWLRERFYEKDRLLDEFYQTGQFPASKVVKKRLCPRYYTLVTLLQTLLCCASFFGWYCLISRVILPLCTWSIQKLISLL